LKAQLSDCLFYRYQLKTYPSIEARDAINVAIMLNHNIHLIISADKHFNQVQEIKRIDPKNFK